MAETMKNLFSEMSKYCFTIILEITKTFSEITINAIGIVGITCLMLNPEIIIETVKKILLG